MTVEPCLCGDPYCARCGYIAPDDCVYRGEVYPEHDYDEVECRRCGAEAPLPDDEEEE